MTGHTAGINVQSPKSDSTPRRLTLQFSLVTAIYTVIVKLSPVHASIHSMRAAQ